MAPPHCTTCGRTFNLAGFCGACAANPERFHFDRVLACAVYEGPVRSLLHRYKFGRKTVLNGFLADRLHHFAANHLRAEDFDAVAAVPLDPERRDQRGFNQSGVLSAILSRRMKLKDLSPVLARNKSVSAQSLLSKRERRTNVRGAFFLRDQKPFSRFKRVLLVDDILTSGQTLSECARTLKAAGAESVTALAFARAL